MPLGAILKNKAGKQGLFFLGSDRDKILSNIVPLYRDQLYYFVKKAVN